MPLEAWPLSFIYSVVRDGWSFVTGRNSKRIERGVRSREKWKEPIRQYLFDTWSKGLRDEIIIRDFSRFSTYPDVPESKGISPWFKVGLLDLYHNGVMVGLRVSRLIFEESEGSWRKAGELEKEVAVSAYLVGYIPFENIESIDFEGDEYYSFPHFVCHFGHKSQPYERIAYCEQKSLDGKRHFYTDIEDYEAVNLTSAKFGTHLEW